mmetsp:Transcript_8421/g.18853  ORF Transcript_8421/g.18853 Transcript_8421/m.18853 type:complete len:274 (+) Transcript_8421:61-882(+)
MRMPALSSEIHSVSLRDGLSPSEELLCQAFSQVHVAFIKALQECHAKDSDLRHVFVPFVWHQPLAAFLGQMLLFTPVWFIDIFARLQFANSQKALCTVPIFVKFQIHHVTVRKTQRHWIVQHPIVLQNGAHPLSVQPGFFHAFRATFGLRRQEIWHWRKSNCRWPSTHQHEPARRIEVSSVVDFRNQEFLAGPGEIPSACATQAFPHCQDLLSCQVLKAVQTIVLVRQKSSDVITPCVAHHKGFHPSRLSDLEISLHRRSRKCFKHTAAVFGG